MGVSGGVGRSRSNVGRMGVSGGVEKGIQIRVG